LIWDHLLIIFYMKKVTVYSTSTCGFCKMLREFLDENKIIYTDRDVTEDEAASRELVEKSGQMGVPVVIITDDAGKEKVIVGFDKDKIKESLEIN